MRWSVCLQSLSYQDFNSSQNLFVQMAPTPEPSRTLWETAQEAVVPKKQKAKILRKQALESLKQSTQSMSTCNRMLTQVVICSKRESQSQSVSQIVRGEVVPTFIVTRALQDAMAMRAASAKVHKITQSNLHCNCHFVHLRLDTPRSHPPSDPRKPRSSSD